jgi:hypothetical protein
MSTEAAIEIQGGAEVSFLAWYRPYWCADKDRLYLRVRRRPSNATVLHHVRPFSLPSVGGTLARDVLYIASGIH